MKKKKRKRADPLVTLCPSCEQPWVAQGVRIPDKNICSLCGQLSDPETRTTQVRESAIKSWVGAWTPTGIAQDTWAVFPRRVGTTNPPSYQVRFRSRNQHFDVGSLLEPDETEKDYDPLDHARRFCDMFVQALGNVVMSKRARR